MLKGFVRPSSPAQLCAERIAGILCQGQPIGDRGLCDARSSWRICTTAFAKHSISWKKTIIGLESFLG
jgi:hypothetical protein